MINPSLLGRLQSIKLVIFDFDGVFTDNAVWVLEDGREMVRCSRGDGFGLRLLEKVGVKFWVLSTEENPVVTERCRKIKCPVRQNVWNKRPVLDELCAEAGVTLAEAAYLGNDINDLPCLQAVGFPAIVADSHPAVEGAAAYRTVAKGGYGAVRELCDLIVLAKGGAGLL
jgi:YrbI family 3-deoxy-D-manno-octulosonate 8-phosphate phosphatase